MHSGCIMQLDKRGLKDTTNSIYFLLFGLVIQLIHHFTAPDYFASILLF